MWELRARVEARLVDAVGGHTRLRVVAILAAVLALDSADKSSVGAVAPQLEESLGIGNVEVGLLATVTTAVAALATLPLGILTDRVHRVRLLAGAVLLWSVAVAASGLSQSFLALLSSRVLLGVIAAAAGPTIGSLVGDLFPAAERGRIYGFVLAGELVGAGLGFLLSGDIAAVLSWRYAFWCLGALGAVLAVVLLRHLPEPERGGGSWLPAAPGSAAARAEEHDGEAATAIVAAGVAPHERLVLREDPAQRPLGWAVRYVLAIPTNRVLILASALGYFFLAGLRTFAVVFFRGRFGVSQSAASTLLVVLGSGAILGVLLTGRLADRAVGRGRLSARPVVAGVAYLATAAFLVPAMLAPGLMLAAPLLFLAAVGLGGANPPLDAARLDVMHSRLRGRAEAVRSVGRSALEALAPLCFGLVSVLFGAPGTTADKDAASAGSALASTVLVMLVPVVAAGLLLCVRARRTYPRDVATALASQRRTDAALRG